MRVIICGGNQVGGSIASYLSKENNDVTVIDADAQCLAQISNTADVNTVTGHPSDPNTLNIAGANECEMIIAVTENDEVNMIACQTGHSLFGIPKKIARIRKQCYLDPAWSNLFSRAHMPIDVIISPEVLVAENIMERLSVPGTTTAVKIVDGAMHLVGVICQKECPVLHTRLEQLGALFPDLSFSIVSITRNGKTIMPDENDMLEVGDEAYMIVDSKHLRRVMAAFGHMEKDARRIVISGGGNIGLSLIRKLQSEIEGLQLRVIEHNPDRAQFLSENLQNTIILNGNTLETEILKEASVSKAEAYIALTNDDESNILGSLLAKQHGCKRTITLVNNNAYYPLVGPLGIDVMVSPRTMIVASVMQHVRRGRVKAIHTLRDGTLELADVEVTESLSITHTKIRDIELPSDVLIGAVYRNDQMILPTADVEIMPQDRLIVFYKRDKARKVEKLLSVQVDL